ncbi:hypothetical protein BIW11_08980 [Tropilaelaps mercedesae]|uniref:Uncharacterized protein n=1 Tax=Tropilaelaps mercedesae TaxID=418985 RepID=A0A1V9XM54_9ACAR|nr:hypothetical protein BIW11_08980 [Tropilaelaps mercedesae]
MLADQFPTTANPEEGSAMQTEESSDSEVFTSLRSHDAVKRRKQEKLREKFQRMTKIRESWENLNRIVDCEIEAVKAHGEKLQRAYQHSLCSTYEHLSAALTEDEARVSAWEAILAICPATPTS